MVPDRLATIVSCLVLAGLILLELESIQGLPRSHVVRPIADVLVGVAAVVAISGVGPLLMVAVGSVVSLTISVIMGLTVADPPVLGAAELVGLLCLLVVGVRQARTSRRLVAVVFATSTAVIAGGLLRVTPGVGVAADLAYLGSSVTVATACGLWWRAANLRREIVMAAYRQSERLELARELHDDVAHHITGIVVQLQALHRVADDNPALVVEALPMLEAAATRSLEAMRQMVWSLRDSELGPAPVRHDDVTEVLNRVVSSAGVPAQLNLGIAENIEVAESVTLVMGRVISESLTNVARHAPAGSTAYVSVTVIHGTAMIRVSNASGGASGFTSGAGVGITGLRERVELLGGQFDAGPAPGGGWLVVATIPLARRS